MARELARWRHLGRHTRFFLGTTPDGLLALSATRGTPHGPTLYLLLEPRDEDVALAAWALRPDSLARAPDTSSRVGFATVTFGARGALEFGELLRADFHEFPRGLRERLPGWVD